VKKLEDIPEVLVQIGSQYLALIFMDHGLVGQFTGIWPSPKSVAVWIDKNWKLHLKVRMSHSFCGRGFFTFLFEEKEDRDLIFRSGPYFMGARGLYLNRWTLDFNPENDIPSTVLVWVRLPFLPLHCWNEETIKEIGNSLGWYIDNAEPKEGLQACAWICVEVDLKKRLPEVVKLKLYNWTFL
jgi:hypothetical protein